MLKRIFKRFKPRLYVIDNKTYVETKNAYESDLMIYKRGIIGTLYLINF